MATEVNIECEPIYEVIIKNEPPSVYCEQSEIETSDPICFKPVDLEVSDTRCQAKYLEPGRPMCQPVKETSAPEYKPTVPESSKSKCEMRAPESSEEITAHINPEFIYVKQEPTESLEINLVEIQNDDLHLVEIKSEQTGYDYGEDFDMESYQSNEETELEDFDESKFNRSSTGQYQCPTCQKWLSNKGHLQRHLLIHNKEKLTCKYCGILLTKVHLLKKHIEEDHKKTFERDACHKVFRTGDSLNQHNHINPFNCQLCDKSFSTMANLIKHNNNRCKKPNAEPLHCDICDKNFKTKYRYKSHQVKHSTERPYQCNICKMTFKQTCALSRHTMLHNNEKPYSCDICGKKFTSKGLLKPHMRSHTGEKPFPCPVCQRNFKHKHDMKRHSLLHNIVKHLICEICHKEFPRESRLKYHMRKHMPDNRPYKCEHCPKCYSRKQSIIDHYKKKHPTKTYDSQETDASLAAVMWETVIKQKLEVQKDYILPDDEVVPVIGFND